MAERTSVLTSESSSRPIQRSSSGNTSYSGNLSRECKIWAVGFLALTVALLLVWSSFKLLWFDELLVLWTDQVPGFERLIQIQRFYPVSLDPILYHAVSHAAIRAFGANAFALRFPSVLGFLTMQACLLIFVRRIAGEWAGIIALAFPALTPALRYAIEGRPYGMMLGLTGIIMVSWQTAARRESKRAWALVALGLATALVLNTHYLAVLLLIPLCAGEGLRILQLRKVDFPVLASIGAGMLGFLFVMPFWKGAFAFRAHIYDLFVEPGRMLTAYHLILPGHFFHVQALFVLILCYLLLRSKWTRIWQHEEYFLLFLAMLPIFGFLLGRFVTHTFVPRYSIAAVAGLSGLVGIELQPVLARLRTPLVAFGIVILTMLAASLKHITAERLTTKHVMSSLTLSPDTKAVLQARHDQPIYIHDYNLFAYARYYEPDPDLRSRLAFLYSRDLDLRILGQDTIALTAIHLTQFTDFKIASFEALAARQGDHLFVISKDSKELTWMKGAIAAYGGRVYPQAKGFGGTVAVVHF